MSECCIATLEKLLKEVNDKFSPLLETSDPNVPLTEEQFGIFKVLTHLATTADKMVEGKL